MCERGGTYVDVVGTCVCKPWELRYVYVYILDIPSFRDVEFFKHFEDELVDCWQN